MSADFEKDAQAVAAIVRKTNTDYRGDLLLRVAEILKVRGQCFTASVIRDAGIKYSSSIGNATVAPTAVPSVPR